MEIVFVLCIVIFFLWGPVEATLNERNAKKQAILQELLQKEYLARMHSKGEQVYSPSDWLERKHYTLSRDRNKCQQCGTNVGLEIHHIVPRKVELNHSVTNLITLCLVCHHKEHGRTIVPKKAEILHNKRRNSSIPVDSRSINKVTTARKSFKCDKCLQNIEKGNKRVYVSKYNKRIGRYNRYAGHQSYSLCTSCCKGWENHS